MGSKKDSKKEWYEQAAKEENEYVRAVILKPDHPAKDEALEIATQARDMAKRALGKDHPSYAEAIQNLGLYHAVIENNDNKANEFFDEARAVVGQYHPVLSRTFYFLSLYYEQAVGDIAKAEHFCNETLAIVRREGYPNDPRVAQILEKLAQLKSAPQSRRQSPANKSAGAKAKSGRRSPIKKSASTKPGKSRRQSHPEKSAARETSKVRPTLSDLKTRRRETFEEHHFVFRLGPSKGSA